MQISGGRIPGKGMTKGKEPELATGELMGAHLADWGSSKGPERLVQGVEMSGKS